MHRNSSWNDRFLKLFRDWVDPWESFFTEPPPEMTMIKTPEALQLRIQCPEEALDNYLAALQGERGDVPAVMAQNAKAVVPHLEQAVACSEQLKSLVEYYSRCWVVRN